MLKLVAVFQFELKVDTVTDFILWTCVLKHYVAPICIHTVSGVVTPLVFNFGTKCECLTSHTSHFIPRVIIPNIN